MILLNRSVKPKSAEEINFSLPQLEKLKLENGLEVYFIKKDKLPILQFDLVISSGSICDLPGKKGLSNLFAMTVDEGAGDFDALALSDEFDSLGSNFSVYSSQDYTYFGLQTLKEHFKRSLELLGTVLTKPHFNDKDFEREQRKIITRLLQIKDEPDEIADSVFERNLFGSLNPYAYQVAGYESDVRNISTKDIKEFYKTYITPGNSVLIVVGNSDVEELKEALNRYLNDWKAGPANQIEINWARDILPSLYIFDKKDSVQTEIRVGHLSTKRNDVDYFPKTILNTILGGQFTSRINLNLRENKGYTYGALSRFNYFKYESYFGVSTSVGTENTGSALNEIFNELRGIKNGVLPSELDFAKSSLIRKFPSSFETYKQIAANLTGMVVHSLPDDYFNTYIDNIKNVTLDDVNSAVKYISPENSTVVLVGEKEKIIPQLGDEWKDMIIEVDIEGKPLI